MKIMNYKEWSKYHNIEPVVEVCDQCTGSGIEECSHCGQQRECNECYGKGEIDLTEMEYVLTVNRQRELLRKIEEEGGRK